MPAPLSDQGGSVVGPDGRELTVEEEKAIASLKRLAKKWPDSLVLFSWAGSLVIFKADEWGPRPDYDDPRFSASDYVVDTIAGITNDGGDP